MAANANQITKLDQDRIELDRIERQLRTIDVRHSSQLSRILSSLIALDEDRYADLIDMLGRISDGD